MGSNEVRHVRHTVYLEEGSISKELSGCRFFQEVYPIDSSRNHVHGRPCSIAASVILIPGILFTRLSHSSPLSPLTSPSLTVYPRLLVDFGHPTNTRHHLLSYPLELRRGTSAPSGPATYSLDLVQLSAPKTNLLQEPRIVEAVLKRTSLYVMLDLISALPNDPTASRCHTFILPPAESLYAYLLTFIELTLFISLSYHIFLIRL